MRTSSRPVVVFFGDDSWHCFDQLAAALRNAHIDAVRAVTSAATRGRYARAVDRMLYREIIELDTPDGIVRLRHLVDSGRVVDAQVNEVTLARVGARSETAELISRITGIPVGCRAEWIDKLALAARVEALGFPLPGYASGADVSPDAAAALLGLPIVVKHRTGTGGTAVRIADDHESLLRAVAELGTPPSALLYQQFIPGELVGYGAARFDSGTAMEFTARETKGRTNPLGPTAVTHTIDDDALTSTGRQLLDALGCRGLVAIELLVDADGAYRFIDLSTRAWGGFLSFRAAGVDFASAYVDNLRGAAVPTGRVTEPGWSTRVVPAALEDDAVTMPLWRLVNRMIGDIAPYVRRLGIRYALVVALGVVVSRRDARTRMSQARRRPLVAS